MKRFLVMAAVAVVLVAGVASAQQQMPAQPAPVQQMPMHGGGVCPMTGGGMMGGGMMGMMGGQADSPRLMQMRGEMMKAIGDIMVKYGKMMEGAAAK